MPAHLTLQSVVDYLEALAPPCYQADYDRSGMQVGDPAAPVRGILLALDPTQEVLEEARQRQCNVIITHHPLLFRPVREVTPSSAVTRMIRYAIAHDLHLYALHTNLDHCADGLNLVLAQRLGLQDNTVLEPLENVYNLLTTYVPDTHLEALRNRLFEAGAGQIDAYQGCSFATSGKATFVPDQDAQPFLGKAGTSTTASESALRTMVPRHRQKAVLRALHEAHPYQTPIYHLQPLDTPQHTWGTGLVGNLPHPLDAKAFLAHVKTTLDLPNVRYTQPPQPNVKRVALCSGSGSTFLPQALRAKADAFITCDTKYHQFFDALGKLLYLDIGHYESEIAFKDLLYKQLTEKFDNIAVLKCLATTNPIHHF